MTLPLSEQPQQRAMLRFAATNGDATLTVADTAHGALQNDFVTYSGAVSLGWQYYG